MSPINDRSEEYIQNLGEVLSACHSCDCDNNEDEESPEETRNTGKGAAKSLYAERARINVWNIDCAVRANE